MLTANRVMIHNLMASRVSANVELENGKLLLTDLRGDVLGGKHRGEWKADFTAKSPEYSGSGSLERVALGQLAEAMQDDWITGTVSATYHATLSGRSKAELLSSASTSLQLDAHDGLLPRFVLSDGSGPLQMHRFVGRFLLRSGMFEIQEGKLETSGSAYEVSGTASLSRILDLKLRRSGAPGFSITGTLTEPHVVPTATPETRAALKP
jgi:uncharacterized protein involved in outer membrane biogenesis